MNEALFRRLPGGEGAERPVEAQETHRIENRDDVALESGLEYTARVMQELRAREAGVADATRRKLDEIAQSVGITPLQLREVLRAIGADTELSRIHGQMGAHLTALDGELRQESGSDSGQWN